MGKRGGALANWHPVDLLAFALTELVERTGIDTGHRRRRHRGMCHPGRGAEHQRHPERLGGGRPAPDGAGHHGRPPVRLVAAGHALRRRRGEGRPLRPGGGVRSRDDEPGPHGVQRPGRDRPVPAVVPRSRSTAGCGPSSGWPRFWPTGGVISREEMDEYSLESHRRAAAAWDSGHFANETVAVPDQGRGRHPHRGAARPRTRASAGTPPWRRWPAWPRPRTGSRTPRRTSPPATPRR